MAPHSTSAAAASVGDSGGSRETSLTSALLRGEAAAHAGGTAEITPDEAASAEEDAGGMPPTGSVVPGRMVSMGSCGCSAGRGERLPLKLAASCELPSESDAAQAAEGHQDDLSHEDGGATPSAQRIAEGACGLMPKQDKRIRPQ